MGPRLGIAALALMTALTGSLLALTRAGGPDEANADGRPIPNVKGSDIQIVANHGENGTPEVLPRSPLHLVVDDCAGLVIPPNEDSFLDAEDGIMGVDWWDPGVGEDRSLTILYRTPSCASHEGVRIYTSPEDDI